MSLSDRDIQRFLDQPAGPSPVDVVDRERAYEQCPVWFLPSLAVFLFGWVPAIVGTVVWAAWRWTLRAEWR